VRERYGNLFDMYEKITGENAYQRRCAFIRRCITRWADVGGLQFDEHVPGLFVLGEANFSDHGANRLGASALMQGLADGYFVLPYTIGNYFATAKQPKPRADQPEFKRRSRRAGVDQKAAGINGKRTVNSFHKELGKHDVGKMRHGPQRKGIEGSCCKQIPALREEFWKNVKVTGENEELNQNLEHAGRVADFLEFAELLAWTPCTARESCGGHFRTEYQTRTARPSATTRISPTWPPGNTPGRASRHPEQGTAGL
jgi:succinate dehydrogenase / fumarate reductase, flavoprotein subunit